MTWLLSWRGEGVEGSSGVGVDSVLLSFVSKKKNKKINVKSFISNIE